MIHFLNTPAARSLSIAQVLRLSDEEAFATFQRVRFAANGGEPYCPNCGCAVVYTLAETPIRWKCSGCRKKFSVTSGTIFHSRKLAIRDYLAVTALFCNGVKGVAALRLSRDMNINPKSAFVLLHKLREAMGATLADDGACTNQAESYFSRLRRSEFGIHHRISGRRLQAYADECAWRENHRRLPNGTHWNLITAAALAHPKSATWAGYWHREKAA